MERGRGLLQGWEQVAIAEIGSPMHSDIEVKNRYEVPDKDVTTDKEEGEKTKKR